MEDSDTSAGEQAGPREGFAGAGGTSQSLLAYAVAGVALAAVIASAVMFVSHYPSSPQSYPEDAQGERTQRAPLHLVSPRAITVEEMGDSGDQVVSDPSMSATASPESPLEPPVPAAEIPVPAAEIDEPARVAEIIWSETTESVPPASEASLAEAPAAALSPDEESLISTDSAAPGGAPESQLVSAILRSETLDSQPPIEGLALGHDSESPALREPPAQHGVEPPVAASGVEDGEIARGTRPTSDETTNDEPGASGGASPAPAQSRGYPYPRSRPFYSPPLPRYPPPPYLRRNPGQASGYYRMNTADKGN